MPPPATLIASLAQLLGLDEATTKEQILPYMATMRTSQEVQSYLETLLAPGPASQSFIRSYLNLRFPPPPPPKPTPPPPVPTDAWGKPIRPSTSAASSRASSRAPATTRGLVSQEERLAIEKEFGNKGKVYVKNRDDDDGGWGGTHSKNKKGGNGSATASGRASPLPPAVPAPAHPVQSRAPVPTIPRAAPASSSRPQSNGKGKNTAASTPADVVELSETATLELLAIDRLIKSFSPRSTSEPAGRTCFCQARQHPLSTYISLCPSCALVLCTLNSPVAPCPSCSYSPLLSSTTVATHLATLHSRREEVLTTEQRRITREREEAERERAAIRFPGLGDDRAAKTGGSRAYADLVGGGMLVDKIERAYAEGRTVGGKEFGKREPAATMRVEPTRAPGKVLRLDMKTKKVHTVTKVKVKKPVVAAVSTESTPVVSEAEHDEEDDGEVAWIDLEDDGYKARTGNKSSSAVEPPSTFARGERIFVNLTLAEDARPLWIEDVEPEPEETVADAAPVEVEKGAVPGLVKGDAGRGKGRRKGKGKGKEAGGV